MTRLELLFAPLTAVALAMSPATLAQDATKPTPTPGSDMNRAPATTPSQANTPSTPSSSATSSSAAPSGATNAKVGATSARAQRDWDRSHRASKIIGTDVRNLKNEKIGDVKDIVLDTSGNVAYAVVSTGGFLGMGDRLHAVPWSALQKNASGKDHFVLDVDKARLSKVPGFNNKTWPNFADERWNSENRKYYDSGK